MAETNERTIEFGDTLFSDKPIYVLYYTLPAQVSNLAGSLRYMKCEMACSSIYFLASKEFCTRRFGNQT